MNGLEDLFVFGLTLLAIVLFDAATEDLKTARGLRASARLDREAAATYYADAQLTLAAAWAAENGHPAAATIAASLPAAIGLGHERGTE